MEREIRYCTSADGTRIVYTVYGEGPALVRCPAFWETFVEDSDEYRVYDLLDSGRTVVRFDHRGVGLSQRSASSCTFEDMTADLEAVVSAARLDRFAVQASNFSSPVAIAYAARHPQQVVRMILTTVMTSGPDVMPRANADALIALAQTNWKLASQAFADASSREGEPTFGIRTAAALRRNMDASDFVRMVADLYETADVSDMLKGVQCATLIAHRRDDAATPFSCAEKAAASIPNARLMALPGSGPVSRGPDAEANVRAMVAFLDEDPETRALPSAEAPSTRVTESAFRTILFTDLVGHTEMMSRLGDEKGRDVLREHECITREVLKANGGTEVKTMGDGFMASFGSVTKAVECAVALQKAVDEHNRGVGQGAASSAPTEPLSVRVGLNAGEPIEEDGDLFGATVILASRIAAKADGGEILVADTVRGLCSGKGFLFSDRGEFVAKGFEEPVRVYEVRWRE